MGENFQDQDLSSLLENGESHYAQRYPAAQCNQPAVGGNQKRNAGGDLGTT